MSRSSSDSEELRTLLTKIRDAFGSVSRGPGITLHETEIIDNYGSFDERCAARALDKDRHWWEVPDKQIREFGGVGGIPFLDKLGFRYYLPAFLSYYLRTTDEPFGLLYALEPKSFREFEASFSPAEKRIIAKSLDYIQRHFREREAAQLLETYWNRYLDGPDQP